MADQRDSTPLSNITLLCTDPQCFLAAKNFLPVLEDGKESDEPTTTGPSGLATGHIGAIKITVGLMQRSVRGLDESLPALETEDGDRGEVLVADRVPPEVFGDRDVEVGDVVVSRPDGESDSALSRAVDVLRAEVGEDGSWLAGGGFKQRIHFVRVAPELGGDGAGGNRGRWRVVEGGEDTQTKPTSYLCILGIRSVKDQYHSAAATNVAYYIREIINLSTTLHHLNKTIPSIRNTETVLPPASPQPIPDFEAHQFPLRGSDVLFVIPTANKFKVSTLRNAATAKAPIGAGIRFVTVPADSEVGEQPYNGAGVLGAYNRITNALTTLHKDEHQGLFEEGDGVGTVMVASIESYIQTEKIERPADFGAIVIYNATTGRTVMGVSKGTTVDPEYVDRARRFGFVDGNHDFGRVTVGEILAAHVPGLDKANWQEVLGARSRYELLEETLREMEFPWS